MRFVTVGLLLTSLVLVACGQSDTPESEQSAVRLALQHPDRLADDLEVDARRKPDAVLEFFGIEPGMTVLDMFSGGGYYTEILCHLVGEDGVVLAHNNTPYLEYSKEGIQKRYTPGRLGNVRRITAENNELQLPENTYDAVLLILSYHDIYYVAEDSGWEQIDGPQMLAEIYQAMKPGAVLGVVDHVAEAGSPAETGNTLHRIDPELAKREIVAAGFVFDGENDVLRNPEDDLAQPMYADGIRGKTDRFIFRFRKP